MAESGLLASILGPTYGALTPNYGVQKPYMFGGMPGGTVRPVQSPIMSDLGVAMMDQGSGGNQTGVPGAAASSNVSTAGPTTPNQVPDMGPVGRQAMAQSMANTYSGPNMMLGIMGLMGGPIFNLATRGLKMAMVAHNRTILADQLDKEFKAGRAIGFDPDPTGFTPMTPAQQVAPMPEFGLRQDISPLTPAELALANALANRADTEPDAPAPDSPGNTPGAPSGDPGAPGGNEGDTSSSGGGVADFDKGGLVPRRMKARLAGGEYIIQAPAVPRNIKLLKKINQGTPAEVRRMARRVAQ